MQKNEVYEIEIGDLTVEGNGVGRIDGMAVFVPKLLPGERAKISIIKVAKRYAVGRLVSLIKPSPYRVEPPCEAFPRCGGCSLQHLSYAGQLNFKYERVKRCFSSIGKCAPEVSFPLPCRLPFAYRNKAAVPVRHTKEGLRIGCFARRSHEIVETGRCLLQSAGSDRCVHAVRRWMEENGIAPYDEQTGNGFVRHIVVRRTAMEEYMVGIVTTQAEQFPCAKELIRELRLAEDGVMSVVWNLNSDPGNVILGRETRVLFGAPCVREVIGSLQFDISLNTFLQVNHAQTELLYTQVRKMAMLNKKQVVVDLYCGAGTISLFLAGSARKVYGVEVVEQAVKDARRNALLNGVENAEFFTGDAGEIFPSILEREEKIDCVVVDPPRKGLEERVIDQIAQSGADRVVYVSCDPATLARDAARFLERGWRTWFVQPVDLFPQTTNIECVAMLTKEPKQ